MTGSEPNPEEVFDVDRIRQLVELMEEHGLSEIDLRRQEQRIRLRRGQGELDAPREVFVPATPATAPAPVVASADSGQAASQTDGENIRVVKSPMVGTFYCRPNPDAPSFVKLGDPISAETTVCIIEAMKVFNEIPAEISGTIVAILVEDEEPVEFGKPLFKVDTSK